MKKRNIVALFVAIAMVLCMLCSCGAEEVNSDPTSKPKDILRDDVKRAYQFDDEGERLIEVMFACFDIEFNIILAEAKEMNKYNELAAEINEMGLKYSPKFNGDSWFEFAKNVDAIFHSTFYGSTTLDKYRHNLDENKNNGDEADRNNAKEVYDTYIDGLSHVRNIESALRTNSVEQCLESAIGLINEYSRMFYGTDRISDEELATFRNLY